GDGEDSSLAFERSIDREAKNVSIPVAAAEDVRCRQRGFEALSGQRRMWTRGRWVAVHVGLLDAKSELYERNRSAPLDAKEITLWRAAATRARCVNPTAPST